MRKFKYTLAVFLLLGASDPAYAHGEQIIFVLASHLLVLIGMLVFLLFFPAPQAKKTITFMVLLVALVAMWVVPGPIGWLYSVTLENLLLGMLVSIGLPTFIGAITLLILTKMQKKAKSRLHRTQ